MSIAKDFLREIEAFLKKTGMPASTFGRQARKDSKLVYTLRDGRSPTAETIDSIRKFIQNYESP